MNIGAARYWIGRQDPAHGWFLLAATNEEPIVNWPLEVIDRGPINFWTGEPHGT